MILKGIQCYGNKGPFGLQAWQRVGLSWVVLWCI